MDRRRALDQSAHTDVQPADEHPGQQRGNVSDRESGIEAGDDVPPLAKLLHSLEGSWVIDDVKEL
eukprot:2722773-Prymnesium_polylepis.1